MGVVRLVMRMRLSALRLPLFFGGKAFVPCRGGTLGCPPHRENDLAYPPPRVARGRGTILRSKMVEGGRRQRFTRVAGVASRPGPVHHPALAALASDGPPPPLRASRSAGEDRRTIADCVAHLTSSRTRHPPLRGASAPMRGRGTTRASAASEWWWRGRRSQSRGGEEFAQGRAGLVRAFFLQVVP